MEQSRTLCSEMHRVSFGLYDGWGQGSGQSGEIIDNRRKGQKTEGDQDEV